MEAITSFSRRPNTLPARRFLGTPPRTTGDKKMARRIIAAARRGVNNNHQDHRCGGRNKMVDENMIVLRLRIKEMKALEGDDGDRKAEMHWMGWEKEYVKHYNEDVCEFVGLLQRFLMEKRPALGLGLMAVVLGIKTLLDRIWSHGLTDQGLQADTPWPRPRGRGLIAELSCSIPHSRDLLADTPCSQEFALGRFESGAQPRGLGSA
nr:mediator of RNA polymerase II transcription subunit [Ipomoea batatas]